MSCFNDSAPVLEITCLCRELQDGFGHGKQGTQSCESSQIEICLILVNLSNNKINASCSSGTLALYILMLTHGNSPQLPSSLEG